MNKQKYGLDSLEQYSVEPDALEKVTGGVSVDSTQDVLQTETAQGKPGVGSDSLENTKIHGRNEVTGSASPGGTHYPI